LHQVTYGTIKIRKKAIILTVAAPKLEPEVVPAPA
jgi:hypothetical protein